MPPLNQTAYKVSTTTNAYGDKIAGAETKLRCRFREIVGISGFGNRDYTAEAMAWFEPDSGVEEDDLLKIDGKHYRVERVHKARDFGPSIRFLKTDLSRYGDIS